MFDAHNHYTSINSILCSSELLPQNTINSFDINKVSTSEIGLDKRFESINPLERQISILTKLLELAKMNNIPVSIHCVNRTKALLDTLKIIQLDNHMVIWHGFNGSIETAKELNNLGILISIGPKYNKDIKLLYNTVDTLLIESDYEGQSEEEHSKILNDMYNKISNEIGVSINELEEKAINATKAFKDRITFR